MPIKNDYKGLIAPVIGVDEVGRGCLAGPVTAAAVTFRSSQDIELYQDSKQLSEEKRDLLAASVHKNHFVGIGWASPEEVDELNILQATFLAMQRALQKLDVKSGTILVDGRDKIPGVVGFQQRAVIKGDQTFGIIAAASIAAKVARDSFMRELAAEYSVYGFEKHKGYGTAFHRAKIQEYGPSKWHRQSFGGVREYSTPGLQ